MDLGAGVQRAVVQAGGRGAERAEGRAAQAAARPAGQPGGAGAHNHTTHPVPRAPSSSPARPPPRIGFGAVRAPPEQVKETVARAIREGCRMFEVSAALGNEEPTGEAIREAIAASVAPREDFYVICVLPGAYHRPERVEPFCRESLGRCGLGYFDLLVMGSPVAFQLTLDAGGAPVYYPTYCEHDDGQGHAHAPCHKLLLDDVPAHRTWEAMEGLVGAGLAQALGAGNLGAAMLRDLLAGARIRPAVLYAEVHPLFQNWELVRYAQSEGLHVVAFLPLAGACAGGGALCANPVLQRVAGARGGDPAPAVLAWHMHRHPARYSVLCRAVDPEQAARCMRPLAPPLTAAEVHAIDGLESGVRVFGGAAHFGFPFFA